MGSAIAKSGKRAGRRRTAGSLALSAIAKKGMEETKQVLAELDAEDGKVPMKPSKEWTERAMKIAYQQGLEFGLQKGKFEAQQLPSENLVQVIELLRCLHDGRKIDCISSADLCMYIDKYGESVDEAAAICAVMPIVNRVMEERGDS